MTTRTGIMDLTGSGKDLAEMYETRVSGPTGTTHYLSQIHGKDLGSIFYLNANLGGLGMTGTVGADCGHKLLNGTDLGSLFCLKGTVASAISSNTNIINYLISGVSPWGIYDASLWNATTNVLPEARGNGRNVSSSGTITASTGSGNGAAGSIPSIAGSITASLTWPDGSIPGNFTICGITRYTNISTNQFRILTSTSFGTSGEINFVLGHLISSNLGTCYWNSSYRTSASGLITQPTKTNWLVSCAKSSSVTAGNSVLINGLAIGTTTGATCNGTLGINVFANPTLTQTSEFAFSYLVIYNSALTDAQMATVSTKLQNYLVNGNMQNIVEMTPGTFTSNTLTVSGQTGTNLYKNGTYIASASSYYANVYNAFAAFNGATVGDFYHNQSSGQIEGYPISSTAGIGAYTQTPYNGASPIASFRGGNANAIWQTTISGTSYSGEWLQIQFPYSFVLTSHSYTQRSGMIWTQRGPALFYVAGSNDGTTWTLLYTKDHTPGGSSDPASGVYGATIAYTVPNISTAYSYYRLVVNKVYGVTSGDLWNCAEWKLFGFIP